MTEERIVSYAAAVRKLLKGVVYHDDPVWNQIRDYETPIRDYLGKIGLGLHLDDIGSFAYLYDESRDDDSHSALPALTTRRNLSFTDTLLLLLLRERLDEHEMRDLEGSRLILSEDDIQELVGFFTSQGTDARQIAHNITSSVKRLKNAGFLTERTDGRYEVRPLIRAKINADELDNLKARLSAYIQPITEADDETDDEF